MKNDYLWEPGSETDPEVAQLEQLLQGFGFASSPNSFNIPVEAKRYWRPKVTFPLAAAASIILAASAAGFFIQQKQYSSDRRVVRADSAADVVDDIKQQYSRNLAIAESLRVASPVTVKAEPPRTVTHGRVFANVRTTAPRGRDSEAQIAEGLKARRDLMLAMQVASEKLNLAKREAGVNKNYVPSS